MTQETVAMETPARAATSHIVPILSFPFLFRGVILGLYPLPWTGCLCLPFDHVRKKIPENEAYNETNNETNNVTNNVIKNATDNVTNNVINNVTNNVTKSF